MFSSDPLAVTALRLRNAAPQTWEDFLSRLKDIVDEALVAVAEAGPNDILRIQGNAQAYRHLYQVLSECHHQQPTPSV